uniref:Uncharacterized protein n=1 Tax=Acrobeloides nanus TaxID=290746 RepID=A0A914CBQ0_9BILA
MTGQVGDTISQIPNSWVFYLLFITLIIVLILLSILIVINLATKVHAIYKIIRGDLTQNATPLPFAYSSKKATQGSHTEALTNRQRLKSFDISMENEPRRFGYISRQTNLNSQQSDSLVGINKNILNANIIENGYIETEDHVNELEKKMEPYIRKNKPTTITSVDLQSSQSDYIISVPE